MAFTEQDVIEKLRGVKDPALFKDLVTLNQIKGVKVVEGNVAVEISTASPLKERIRQEVIGAVRTLAGVEEVLVNFTTSLGSAKAAGGGADAPPKPAAKK